MTYDEMYMQLVQEFPDTQLVKKSTSRFMRVLNTLLIWVTFNQQQHFMLSYTTTIGSTIYVPSRWDTMLERDKISILRHERVHLRQQQLYGKFWFAMLYLFAYFPVGLAYYRMKFEQEAYEETMLAHAEFYGVRSILVAEYRRHILSFFTTGAYLWMWPFKGSLESWYFSATERIARTLRERKKQSSGDK